MRPFHLKEIQEIVSGRFMHLQPAELTITGVSTDSRTCKEGDVFFPICGEKFDGHDFIPEAVEAGAAAVVVSREIPKAAQFARRSAFIYVKDTTRALGLLAGEYRRRLGTCVIAVTGSVGKTTVKEMIHHVLRRRFTGYRAPGSFNNHVGVPLTLFAVTGAEDYVVVELGTNHRGEIAQLTHIARPDVSVITRVCPTHCEGLGDDLDLVAREKGAILDELPAHGLGVLNGDDENVYSQRRRYRGSNVIFGTADHCQLRAEHIEVNAEGIAFVLNDRFPFRLPVLGEHNVHNALAAIAVARRFGLEMDEIAEALADVSLPKMRLQLIETDSLTVINDAYNASPASMTAALGALAQVANGHRRVAVLGDMLELGRRSRQWHRKLGGQVVKAGVDLLVAVGEYAETVAGAATAAGLPSGQVATYKDTAAACRGVRRRLRSDDVVLVKGSRSLGLDKLVEKLTADGD